MNAPATHNTPAIDSDVQKASQIFKDMEVFADYLACRWEDEKEYEDIKDYGEQIKLKLDAYGVKFLKINKRPFSFEFDLPTIQVKVTVGRYYKLGYFVKKQPVAIGPAPVTHADLLLSSPADINLTNSKYRVSLLALPNPDYSDDEGDPRGFIRLPEEWVGCDTFGEACAIVSKFIEFHELGSGNYDGGNIKNRDGVIIAHISYNCRVWIGAKNEKGISQQITRESNGKKINQNATTTYDPAPNIETF